MLSLKFAQFTSTSSVRYLLIDQAMPCLWKSLILLTVFSFAMQTSSQKNLKKDFHVLKSNALACKYFRAQINFPFLMLLVFCANKANIVIYYILFTSIQNNLTTKNEKKKESVCKELAHSGTCVILHFEFLCKVWLFFFFC